MIVGDVIYGMHVTLFYVMQWQCKERNNSETNFEAGS